MKHFFFLIFICATLMGCQPTSSQSSSAEQLSEPQYSALVSLLNFFEQNAYDPSTGAYFSEIDNEGTRVSEKVYIVALSRTIYGLAYSAQFIPENRAKAQAAADFLLNNMIAEDEHGEYFLSYVENDQKSESDTLDIWQQAYGLCGLSELYRLTKDPGLLKRIHRLHEALVKRFEDRAFGGFFGNYKLGEGPVSGSKSLQSLMYPITAYMANLWAVDTDNQEKYRRIMRTHLALVSKHAWNPNQQWVNIRFDDQWQVCDNSNAEKPCFTVTPGHNFQLAALFLRTQQWSFLTDAEREHYSTLGLDIVAATMSKDIFSEEGIGKGFVREMNPVNNTIIDARRSWWQHCEALIALSLSGDAYKKQKVALEQFFFEHFIDETNGGEYFFLTEDNRPVRSELKGSIGKSLYHTTEMIRFANSKN